MHLTPTIYSPKQCKSTPPITSFIIQHHWHYQVLYPHNQLVIIQQELSSNHTIKFTKGIITIIIINNNNFKETILFQNHVLHKRRTTNHIMKFIILNTQSSLIQSYSIILSQTQSQFQVIRS